MSTQVKVRDELVFNVGQPPIEFVVAMPAERVSIRDFISARVEQEVAGYNADQGDFFHGLIQPGRRRADVQRLPRCGTGVRSTPPRRSRKRWPPSSATASLCWSTTVRSSGLTT